MGASPLYLTEEYYVGYCATASCRVPIVMPTSVNDRLRESHGYFYCIHGHQNYYPQTSKTERLKEQLETERSRADFAQRRAESEKRKAAAARGQVTRIKNRVGKGVCPCCNRFFENLSRHMNTKHPDYHKD